jgi:hypothetical protein
VARLAGYSEQWLRDPEQWSPNPHTDARAQWADLLRHLLANYPVPTFLDRAWELPSTLRHFERDCWCALAQGRSLRSVEGFPQSVPRRVLHAALADASIHRGQTLTDAVWHAQLAALNASPALKAAVFSSRVPSEFGSHWLWSRLITKFAAKDDSFVCQFGLVTEALTAVRAHRGPFQVEQVLNLPLQELIRHCVRFTTDLLNANGHLLTEAQVEEASAKSKLTRLANSRWQPLLPPLPFASTRGRCGEHPTWQVVELCSIDALREEGRAMNHCVARYAYRCRNGSSAIFSVRHQKITAEGPIQSASFATIEVHPRTRTVVQIRASRNRPANNTVMSIIREWAMANELVCTK